MVIGESHAILLFNNNIFNALAVLYVPIEIYEDFQYV